MIERTLVILKPDCMQKSLAGAVMERFTQAGLSLVACKMIRLQESLLREHYDFLMDKPFFPNIMKYMMECPVLVLVFSGENAIAVTRGLLGPTDSSLAPKGTIRGDFGQDKSRNIAHASDSRETAAKEIARFFTESEIFA
ncbi:MAG: nucleoside-diphosphate kinase [Puniceicoccales bacterium]|jgi:nucleoside-diphosphate kinase|nr:nucleoside-diphosphate kinase [Puniceicoccales bacterium]